MRNDKNDFTEFTNIIQATLGPLTSKLQSLENKVDALNTDRVTRSDIEKLQQGIASAYVPRDSYEPRHAALIERDMQLEMSIRDFRKYYEDEMKELRESGRTTILKLYDNIEEVKKNTENRFKDQQELQLSTEDRRWVRWSQILGYVSIVLAILSAVAQHLSFH